MVSWWTIPTRCQAKTTTEVKVKSTLELASREKQERIDACRPKS
jgi:hypothetical protein